MWSLVKPLTHEATVDGVRYQLSRTGRGHRVAWHLHRYVPEAAAHNQVARSDTSLRLQIEWEIVRPNDSTGSIFDFGETLAAAKRNVRLALVERVGYNDPRWEI